MASIEKLEKEFREMLDLAKSADSVESIKAIIETISKARKRLSDESGDEDEDENLEDMGFHEIDPDAESDEADKWLAENDPESKDEESEESSEDEDEQDEGPEELEFEPREEDSEESEDEESEPEELEEETEEPELEEESEEAPEQEQPQAAAPAEPMSDDEFSTDHRFPDPSTEQLLAMREHTRPWEKRARDILRMRADPSKNPELYRQGQLVAAHHQAHGGRNEAYSKFINSDDYKKADKISRMKLTAEFNRKWAQENPEHTAQALSTIGEAHKKGSQGKGIFDSSQKEKIEHVLRGGAQSDSGMSTEEAMQHAGGAKGEEGTQAAIVQDPATAFASGNKEFLDRYRKSMGYEKKKQYKSVEDMGNFDEAAQGDIAGALGSYPGMDNPQRQALVNSFFKRYMPLIEISARKAMAKLGLDPQKSGIDLNDLHEAGTHGLYQAINDYDSSKGSFRNHAGHKIRGLMLTMLGSKDSIPKELRSGAKKFDRGQTMSQQPQQQPSTETAPASAAPATPEQPAAPPKPSASDLMGSHSAGADMTDRLKRINSQRGAQGITPPKKPDEGGQQ